MYEVCIKIRFSEPCLGSERSRGKGPDKMERSPEGNVIISAVRWRFIMVRAADVYNRHQKRVLDVMWNAEIDGTTKIFKRHYRIEENGQSFTRVKEHEAFLRGDTVGVRALVPDDIPIREFEEILSLAGEYFGISPFGWKRGFGKFKVMLVEKMYDRRRREHAESKPAGEGEHACDSATDTGDGEGRGESDNVSLPVE